MTPSHLKALHLENNPDSHFFNRKTMVFFGDTMGNYGVRKDKVIDRDENEITVWVLYRKKPVKCGSISNAYFGLTSYKLLHGIKG